MGSLAHSVLILYKIRFKLEVHLWNIPISVFMRLRNIRFLRGVSLVYYITVCFLKIRVLSTYRPSFPADILLRRLMCTASECITWMTITKNPVRQSIFVINTLKSSLNKLTDLFILWQPNSSLVYSQPEKRRVCGLSAILILEPVICIIAIARMALLITLYN